MKKRIYVIVSIFLILILLVSATVTSFVSQFLEDDTLKVLWGHEDTFRILLRNSKEDDDKVITIEIDSNVASIDGKKSQNYTLEQKSDQEVFFTIALPDGHKVGDIYNVSYKISESAPKTGEKAMISMGVAYIKYFKVLVVSQNPPRFDVDFIRFTAYVKKLFEYDVNCKDEDGDELHYVVNKKYIDIDENGILSFTPKFFGRKTIGVICSDGLDIAVKTIVIGIRDPLFFIRWWFLTLVVISIVTYIVISKKRKRELKEEIEKDIREK